MARPFDAFVIFAEMRTGSNQLEESLRALPDVTCHGEVFNPGFIGHHNGTELLGFDIAARERDPHGLLRAILGADDTLNGFRFFHDHDPRVLDPIIENRRIAKVILSRNPLDAYVSRKIAQSTGQWRLTDLKQARSTRITFDEHEFTDMLTDWGTFRARLRRGLQATGQTAFHIRYDEINEADVLSGLARFLGSAGTIERASGRLKRQNPLPLRDKVDNFDAMQHALSLMDPFSLDDETAIESPRGPGVPNFVLHPEIGLLLIPIPGAPRESVLDWMAAIGGVGRKGLLTGLRQKDLRRWLRLHPGFVSFTVARHPENRVAAAFARLAGGSDLAPVLEERYGLRFSHEPSAADGAAFCAFLKGAISGQTSVRVEPDWATQTSHLQGAAKVLLPQRIIRESEAPEALADIARDIGVAAPDIAPETPPGMTLPADAVADAYRRDFLQFGFDGGP